MCEMLQTQQLIITGKCAYRMLLAILLFSLVACEEFSTQTPLPTPPATPIPVPTITPIPTPSPFPMPRCWGSSSARRSRTPRAARCWNPRRRRRT